MTQRNVTAVVLWMSGTLLSFLAAAVGVRALSSALSVFEILTLRNAAGVGILLASACLRPSLRAGMIPRRFGSHLVRNIVHFGSTYTWALAITILPLATVFALEFTTPAWVALLAVLVLHERMTTSRLASILLGFLGVVVILRPGTETLRLEALLMLAAAFGFAVSTIVTKRLTSTESTFSILLWMNLIQLPLAFVGAAPGFWRKLDASMTLPLLGICLGGFFSHLCLTNAYRHGDAIMVVPLDFLRIPLIALIGWGLYGEALDPAVFAGAAIIVAGVLWNLAAETRR